MNLKEGRVGERVGGIVGATAYGQAFGCPIFGPKKQLFCLSSKTSKYVIQVRSKMGKGVQQVKGLIRFIGKFQNEVKRVKG